MTCTSGCNYSLCTPDDGCGRHLKHVEWPGSKINKDCLELHLVGYLKHRRKCLFGRNSRNALLVSSLIVTTIDSPNLGVDRTAFMIWYGLFFCSSLMLIAWWQVGAENRLMSFMYQRTLFYTSVSFTAQIYSVIVGNCHWHMYTLSIIRNFAIT
jgi:hypothetical protein